MPNTLPLVKGTLDVLVLKALTWSPMHGFEVTSWLEERGWVIAEWGVTANNQRARYYRLTKEGRAHLAAETALWVRYANTVTGILTAASGRA